MYFPESVAMGRDGLQYFARCGEVIPGGLGSRSGRSAGFMRQPNGDKTGCAADGQYPGPVVGGKKKGAGPAQHEEEQQHGVRADPAFGRLRFAAALVDIELAEDEINAQQERGNDRHAPECLL